MSVTSATPSLRYSPPVAETARRHRPDQPQEQRDVVGSEAPKSVLLGAKPPEVQSVRVRVEHLPELPFVDQPAQRKDSRVILQDMSDR